MLGTIILEGPEINGKKEDLLIDLTNGKIMTVRGEILRNLDRLIYSKLEDLKYAIHAKIKKDFT